jgi:hypothetical protein
MAAHLPPAVRRPYTDRRPIRSCNARAKHTQQDVRININVKTEPILFRLTRSSSDWLSNGSAAQLQPPPRASECEPAAARESTSDAAASHADPVHHPNERLQLLVRRRGAYFSE